METKPNPVPRPESPRSPLADVRTRVLADHARLKIVIKDVDRLASAVAAGEVERLESLRERAEALYRMLAEHIEREEAALAPIVERIDCWGPVRAEQLRHEHAGQKMTIQQAARDLAIEGRPLGQTVQSMCWEILHDMKREEHDLLHPDLWLDAEIGGLLTS